MRTDKSGIRRLEIEVEKLILHGLTSADAELIGIAMERKIVEMVNRQGSLEPTTENKEVPLITIEPFAINPSSGPERIGAQVARVVGGEVGM